MRSKSSKARDSPKVSRNINLTLALWPLGDVETQALPATHVKSLFPSFSTFWQPQRLMVSPQIEKQIVRHIFVLEVFIICVYLPSRSCHNGRYAECEFSELEGLRHMRPQNNENGAGNPAGDLETCCFQQLAISLSGGSRKGI